MILNKSQEFSFMWKYGKFFILLFVFLKLQVNSEIYKEIDTWALVN
jgi:hypothetical protein